MATRGAAAMDGVKEDSPLQTISLSKCEQGDQAEMERFMNACGDDGFFLLDDHGIRQDTLDGILKGSASLFDLPQAVKDTAHYTKTEVYPGTLGVPMRGYMSIGEELIGLHKDRGVERKEVFDWAFENPVGGEKTPFQGPNLWPKLDEDKGNIFSPAPFNTFRDDLAQVARRLIKVMSVARGLPADHYDEFFMEPLPTFRVLRYQPADSAEPGDNTGCNAHTDQGFFTLLHQDSVGGLQVKLRGDDWVDVPPAPGKLIINIGDALAAATGGLWRSTVHRVMSPPGKHARYSAAAFWDPSRAWKMLPQDVVPTVERVYSDAALGSEEDARAKRAIDVVLFKAGLTSDAAGVQTLKDMNIAEYKHRVVAKYLPTAKLNDDFTDIVEREKPHN